MNGARPLRRIVLPWVVALLLASPIVADRLHLEGGGSIDVDDWWLDGDWIRYESQGGTVGIPRGIVTRIEKRATTGAAGTAEADEPRDARARRPAVDNERLRSLMTEGTRALEDRDFQTASSRFLEAVNLSPELHQARVGYAVAEISLGRDGLALSVVRDGLVLAPDQPQLLELLGDLRYRDEQLEDALASWRRAFGLAPGDRIRDKILKAERELHASRDYASSASSHFNLRYDGDLDPDLAAAVLDHLEEKYWELTGIYRHAPQQPITVQIFPTREFRDVTQSPEWVGGLYDGKIRVPLGGVNVLHDRARRVLTHELTHAVIHSKTRGNAPRWLHEGLAQISEGERLTDARRREIAAGLSRGDPATWAERGFSYPMALGLTRYLQSRQGMDGLVYLLERLGDGETIDEALRAVYGQDYASLCRSWAHEAFQEAPR